MKNVERLFNSGRLCENCSHSIRSDLQTHEKETQASGIEGKRKEKQPILLRIFKNCRGTCSFSNVKNIISTLINKKCRAKYISKDKKMKVMVDNRSIESQRKLLVIRIVETDLKKIGQRRFRKMKINGIGGSMGVNPYNRQANIQDNVKSSNKLGRDKLEISSEAKEMLQGSTIPEDRQAKVDELKAQVESGTYKLNSKATAKGIIDYYLKH